MPRKPPSTNGIAIYSFRVRSIRGDGERLLLQQISAAHNYQHGRWDPEKATIVEAGLVQIELEKRAKFRALRSDLDARVSELEQARARINGEIDMARSEQKEARQRAHAERLAEARQKVGKKKIQVKAERAVDPKITARIAALKEERKRLAIQLEEARSTFSALLETAETELKARIVQKLGGKEAAITAGTHPRRHARLAVLEQMLDEDWPNEWKESKRIEVDASDKGRSAPLSKKHGLLPGTYVLVNDAFQASLAKCRKLKNDPLPRRPDGQGRVGVLIPDGIPVSELCTGKRVLSLDAQIPHEGAPDKRLRQSRSDVQCTARLGGESEPIVCTVRQHRPIPADGHVRRAWFLLRKVGRRREWLLQLTVEAASIEKKKPTGIGVASFHLAWRRLPSGALRVGYLLREDGFGRSLELPAKFVVDMVHVQDLRSANGQLVDRARAVFAEWAAHQSKLPSSAKSLLADIETRRALLREQPWKALGEADRRVARAAHSIARLGSVVQELRDQHVGSEQAAELWRTWVADRRALDKGAVGRDLLQGLDATCAWLAEHGLADKDQQLVMWLEMWRKKERHLFEWASERAERLLLHRKELFGKIAREAARECDTLIIDDTKLDQVAKRPEAEEEYEQWKAARWQRQIASPSALRNAMKTAFGASQRGTSPDAKIHAGCGGKLDPGDGVVVTCSACGASIDRDRAVCERMLERFSAEPDPGGARGSEIQQQSGGPGIAGHAAAE